MSPFPSIWRSFHAAIFITATRDGIEGGKIILRHNHVHTRKCARQGCQAVVRGLQLLVYEGLIKLLVTHNVHTHANVPSTAVKLLNLIRAFLHDLIQRNLECALEKEGACSLERERERERDRVRARARERVRKRECVIIEYSYWRFSKYSPVAEKAAPVAPSQMQGPTPTYVPMRGPA